MIVFKILLIILMSIPPVGYGIHLLSQTAVFARRQDERDRRRAAIIRETMSASQAGPSRDEFIEQTNAASTVLQDDTYVNPFGKPLPQNTMTGVQDPYAPFAGTEEPVPRPENYDGMKDYDSTVTSELGVSSTRSKGTRKRGSGARRKKNGGSRRR